MFPADRLGCPAGAGGVSGVCLDGSGNADIARTFQGTVDFDPGAGTQMRTLIGTRDAYLLALQSNLTW